MRHDYLSNTPLEQALDRLLLAAREAGFYAGEETVPAAKAAGRITARAVYAKISAPHYNAGAMDGIAVSAAKTFGAKENAPVFLEKEDYTVVDTGDPLPPGADAVVMIEDVIELEDGRVKLLAPVAPWQNIRQVGEDLCMGDMICPTGTRVSPALCGALLAGGVLTLPVKKRPVFGIIPTGDEIVKPTADPKRGEIIESNSSIFSAMLAQWDAESMIFDIVPDDRALLTAAVREALLKCDAVLVLAGSSAGRDDYTAEIFGSLGSLLLHGAAIKPGKPVALGFAGDKPLIGLPGYPVSAMVVMEQLVKPLTDLWYTRGADAGVFADAILTKRVVSSLKYEEFVRVTLGKVGDTRFAVPLPRGAGVITSVTKAHGILRVPQNLEGYEAGETVRVRLLCKPAETENTLVITGSHDPLIDEIADEVNRQGRGFTVISSHVGSMGAFRAVGAGQAHMGAIHLLDEADGSYNRSYVEKYFPNGGAVLRSGVERIQGIMVAKGNPLGIRGIEDLARCRCVNRQRGAGTRVLLDFLLKKHGLRAQDLDGYGNEKFTHTAVAATIATGNADAGLGIFSAAAIYGLDFIPVYRESYDFLVGAAFENDEKVRAFFEILHSAAFSARLEEMGGYAVKGDSSDGTDAS